MIKARAPVTGGNFGVWGGMFSTFDCAVKGWRQKEDAWNAIISGFLTGGCLAARSMSHQLFITLTLTEYIQGGPRGAFGSAVACGILLGVFEGVGVLFSRVLNETNRPLPPRKSFPSIWRGISLNFETLKFLKPRVLHLHLHIRRQTHICHALGWTVHLL